MSFFMGRATFGEEFYFSCKIHGKFHSSEYNISYSCTCSFHGQSANGAATLAKSGTDLQKIVRNPMEERCSVCVVGV